MYKDKPIENAEEDLLNRAGFSNSLANAILKWKNKESWIIALTGDWGIGKTSVKNLVVNKIKTTNQDMHIVEFKPWEWSSQDLIMSAFFREIASELELRDNNKKYKGLAEKFRRYSYYLNNIQVVASPTIKLIPLLLGVLLGGSFFIEILPDNTSPELLSTLIISVLAIWLVFFEGLGGLFKSIMDRNEHLAKENSQSITDFKEGIAESLSKLNDPILIIIDDIDRLQRHQILTVVQLVKSNADFENIVFLLLYSKSVLEKKITDNTQTGHEYMEKIVQVEFKVPEPDKSILKNLLEKEFNLIFDSLEIKNMDHVFDNYYFYEAFYKHDLFKYFNNLRSIYKFINSFKFNLLTHFDDGFLEVNITDFIIIESIRLFDPKLYSGIYKHRHLLLGENINNEEVRTKEANDFIDFYDAKKSKNLLMLMFPNFSVLFKKNTLLHRNEKILSGNMISHKYRFDRYFIFSNPIAIITSFEIVNFFENLNNKEVTKCYLDEMHNMHKLNSFIATSKAHIDKLDDTNINHYFRALDYLHTIASNEGVISDKRNINFLCIDTLKKFESNQFKILQALSCQTVPSTLLISTYPLIENNIYDYSISELELNIINDNIVTNLKQFIKTDLEGFIHHHRHLSLLLIWYKANEQESKTYISNLFRDSNTFFQVYSIFIRTSTEVSGYDTSTTTYVDKKSIQLFISLDEFEQLLTTNSNNSTKDNELEMKNLFYKTEGE